MKKVFELIFVSLGLLTLSTMPVLAVNRVGRDYSYPQCGHNMARGQAFGIIGVNGGTPTRTNTCLATQLRWANGTSGDSAMPKVSLYLNTANPGSVRPLPASWPTNNIDPDSNPISDPYGDCTGANTKACAWQYGWNRANEAINDRFIPAASDAGISTDPTSYRFWLDVETSNTWQSGSPHALLRNVADLEGMISYLKSINAKLGLYSTRYQWNKIVGDQVSKTSNLNRLKNWRAGATSLSKAKENCHLKPLTSRGKVIVTQYLYKDHDYDYSCL